MDLGSACVYAPKIAVSLVGFNNEIIEVGSAVPQVNILGAQPALCPSLQMGGIRHYNGYAVWLITNAFIVNGIKYDVGMLDGLLAKMSTYGISPLIQTAPPEIANKTGQKVWPIVKRIYRGT